MLRALRVPALRSEQNGTPTFGEAFRILRANINVALADISKPSVIVTSANDDEGKTTVCCNLATALAAAGSRVVVVDLDLRHPEAHFVLGGHNDFGAAEVLLGQRTLKDSLQYLEPGASFAAEPAGLYFLAAGGAVDSPADVLSGGRTSRLLESLAAQADIVLLDTPPVLSVADTLVVGRIASGALLVTEGGRTGLDAVEKAKALLVRNHTRLFGVAINKFSGNDAAYGAPTAAPPSISSTAWPTPTQGRPVGANGSHDR